MIKTGEQLPRTLLTQGTLIHHLTHEQGCPTPLEGGRPKEWQRDLATQSYQCNEDRAEVVQARWRLE